METAGRRWADQSKKQVGEALGDRETSGETGRGPKEGQMGKLSNRPAPSHR